jgi:hypothetical protein
VSSFEPPIQNLDRFDLIGERVDGGVDLVVVCSGPLDSSPDTLNRLGCKVRNYLREIASETFRARFGDASIAIFLSCAHPVSAAAGGLINVLETEAASQGVTLRLVRDMA